MNDRRKREWTNLWGLAPNRTIVELTRPVLICGVVIGVMQLLIAAADPDTNLARVATMVNMGALLLAVIFLRPLAPALREHQAAERSAKGRQ